MKVGDVVKSYSRSGHHYFKVTSIRTEDKVSWEDGGWVKTPELVAYGVLAMYGHALTPVNGKTEAALRSPRKVTKGELEDIILTLDTRMREAEIGMNFIKSLLNDYEA